MTGPTDLAGLRPTRQRQAVLRVLATSDDFRSAQEWHEAVRDAGEAVGLTTVYRTLAALADAGLVDAIAGEDGETRYRHCADSHHHHHLVCRQCGGTVELSAGEVEAWAAAVAKAHGYGDVSHTIEIFGLCPTCQGAATGA